MGVRGQREITRNDIIRRALRKAGILGDGELMSSTQLQEASEELNDLIQSLDVELGRYWKVADRAQAVPERSVVSHDGRVWRCTRDHISSAELQPALGEPQWAEYWREASDLSSGGVWSVDEDYFSGAQATLGETVVGVERVCWVMDHHRKELELMDTTHFSKLEQPEQLGCPLRACVSEGDNGLSLLLHPQPDSAGYVSYRASLGMELMRVADQAPDFPGRWVRYVVHLLAAALCDTYGDAAGGERYRAIASLDRRRLLRGKPTRSVNEYIGGLY
jgi:hypothetical protein